MVTNCHVMNRCAWLLVTETWMRIWQECFSLTGFTEPTGLSYICGIALSRPTQGCCSHSEWGTPQAFLDTSENSHDSRGHHWIWKPRDHHNSVSINWGQYYIIGLFWCLVKSINLTEWYTRSVDSIYIAVCVWWLQMMEVWNEQKYVHFTKPLLTWQGLTWDKYRGNQHHCQKKIYIDFLHRRPYQAQSPSHQYTVQWGWKNMAVRAGTEGTKGKRARVLSQLLMLTRAHKSTVANVETENT